MIHLPPQTVYRYFNDYLQSEGTRTEDIDINTAIYEALGLAGYTGHIVERARMAVGADLAHQGGFYADIHNIVSGSLLEPNPANLGSSLLAWWDPSDLTTLFQEAAGSTPVTTENDPVGLMEDKSGNSRNFTTTATPAWQEDGSLLFNGTSHFMNLESQPFPSGANPSEIWSVVRQDALAADATNRTILSYGTGLSTGSRNIRRVVSGGVNRLQVAVGDGAGTSTAAEITVDFSGSHVVVASISGTSSYVEIDGTAGTATAVIPNTGTLRTRLGGTTATTPAAFWSGKIGPTVITSSLTTLQKRILELYFNSITLT